MNETEKTVAETAAAEAENTEAKKTEVDELVQAHRRRTALVIYLMILFVAAFVFVVISMISENNKLKTRGDSAIDRAQNYYDEAQTLRQEKAALEAEKQDLSAQLSEAKEQNGELSEENERLNGELAALQSAKEALQKQLDDETAASTLLFTAVTARDSGDAEGFSAAMEALAPLKDKLSAEGLALYEALLEEN